MEKRTEIHAPNPMLETDFPLLVLDVRDGISYPPRVGHNEMHWHEDVQFIIFVQGSASVDTPENHYSCQEGSALLVTPDALHRVTSAKGSVYTSFVFPAHVLGLLPGGDLPLQAVSRRTDARMQTVVHFDGSEAWHGEIAACLAKVRAAAMAESATPEKRYRMVAYLCAAWSCYIDNSEPVAPSKAAAKLSERMRAALAFMGGHYADPIETCDIARAACVSESALLRCFRETLQTTPHAYLQSLRLDKATEFLRDPDVSMAQVAARAGFSDSSHFSRTFKKALGMTPTAYQRALRERLCEPGETGNA